MNVIIRDVNGNELFRQEVTPGDAAQVITSAVVKVDDFDDIIVVLEFEEAEDA